MNISPSDMEVRQGYSSAESVDAQPSVQAERAQAPAAQEAPDAHSQAVAAAADRTLARETAQKLADKLEANDTTLKIRLLEDDSGVQVEVVDQQSNKVLRKIPQDDLVKLSASIKKMTGVLLNHPA